MPDAGDLGRVDLAMQFDRGVGAPWMKMATGRA